MNKYIKKDINDLAFGVACALGFLGVFWLAIAIVYGETS